MYKWNKTKSGVSDSDGTFYPAGSREWLSYKIEITPTEEEPEKAFIEIPGKIKKFLDEGGVIEPYKTTEEIKDQDIQDIKTSAKGSRLTVDEKMTILTEALEDLNRLSLPDIEVTDGEDIVKLTKAQIQNRLAALSQQRHDIRLAMIQAIRDRNAAT